MSARVWSFVAWALVAASATYWGLKLWSRPQAVPAHASVAATTMALQGDFTRVLGADPVVAAAPKAAEAPPDTRMALLGVVAPRSPRHAAEGLALISVDGKPAKAYRVGTVVDGNQVLQSVSLRSASLGPAGAAAQTSLNIAPPAEAARGRPGADGQPAPQGFTPATSMRSQHSAPMPVPGVDVQPPSEASVPGQVRQSQR